MKKAAIGLCGVMVLMMLFGCTKTNTTDEKTSATETTVRTEMTFSAHYEREKKYWANYIDEEGEYVEVVKDTNGKEFYQGLYSMGIFEQLDETIVTQWFSGGNGMSSMRYFDVENRLVSPIYPNAVTAGYGKVAYLDEDDPWLLVVHDMFDSETNRVTFQRNFFLYKDVEFPAADYYVYPFTTAKFLDKNHLHIRYLSIDKDAKHWLIYEEKNFEFVEEILGLN